MNDYQDTPTVIGSRGANRGTTNAAAIKAAKRSGETKVCLFVTEEILYISIAVSNQWSLAKPLCD